MQNERITGDRIYLRPITEADTPLIIRWRNSEGVRPFFIYQKPFTEEGHKQWLKTMIESGNGYQFIICSKADDTPIGSTYLRDYDKECKKAEYGMFIGEPDWKGKGIGTEALKLTIQFAFEDIHLHKVFSRIFSDNQSSIQSVLRGGFEEEAYLKDEVFVNGTYRDIVLLAKINPNEMKY